MHKSIDVLNSACGDGAWLTVCDLDYDTLVMNDGFIKPSRAVWNEAVAKITALYQSREYITQRALAYPPITDYLDGVVKGDQTQIDAYIAACQAVKDKYPKP